MPCSLHGYPDTISSISSTPPFLPLPQRRPKNSYFWGTHPKKQIDFQTRYLVRGQRANPPFHWPTQSASRKECGGTDKLTSATQRWVKKESEAEEGKARVTTPLCTELMDILACFFRPSFSLLLLLLLQPPLALSTSFNHFKSQWVSSISSPLVSLPVTTSARSLPTPPSTASPSPPSTAPPPPPSTLLSVSKDPFFLRFSCCSVCWKQEEWVHLYRHQLNKNHSPVEPRKSAFFTFGHFAFR